MTAETGSLMHQGLSNQNFWHHLFTFIYTVAHQLGLWMVKGILLIFPGMAFPEQLVDPLGYLVILTGFAILLSLFKKLAWIVLTIGWVLMIIRIVMAMLGK